MRLPTAPARCARHCPHLMESHSRGGATDQAGTEAQGEGVGTDQGASRRQPDHSVPLTAPMTLWALRFLSPSGVGFWDSRQSSYFRGSFVLSKVHRVVEPSRTRFHLQEGQPRDPWVPRRAGQWLEECLLSFPWRSHRSKVAAHPWQPGEQRVWAPTGSCFHALGVPPAALGLQLLTCGIGRPLPTLTLHRVVRGARREGRWWGSGFGPCGGPPHITTNGRLWQPAQAVGRGWSAGIKGRPGLLRPTGQAPHPTSSAETPTPLSHPRILGSPGREGMPCPTLRAPPEASVLPFMEEGLDQIPGLVWPSLGSTSCLQSVVGTLGCADSPLPPTPLSLRRPPMKAGEPEITAETAGEAEWELAGGVVIAPDRAWDGVPLGIYSEGSGAARNHTKPAMRPLPSLLGPAQCLEGPLTLSLPPPPLHPPHHHLTALHSQSWPEL